MNWFGSMGLEKPFIRLSEPGSNGFCDVMKGAKTELPINSTTTSAATMATGERRNR